MLVGLPFIDRGVTSRLTLLWVSGVATALLAWLPRRCLLSARHCCRASLLPRQLEVVITGRDGGVWALDAATGLDIDNFPVRTRGKIMAPTTLLKLRVDAPRGDGLVHLDNMNERGAGAGAGAGAGEGVDTGAPRSGDGLQLVVPCHDGHVYVISGATGCVSKVDIGEHVYAAVMAEDLSEDGMLELIVGTMSGNVMAFATDTPYHPLNSQPQFPMGTCRRASHAVARLRGCAVVHRRVATCRGGVGCIVLSGWRESVGYAPVCVRKHV